MYLYDKKIKVDSKIFELYKDIPKYVSKYFSFGEVYLLGYDYINNHKMYLIICFDTIYIIADNEKELSIQFELKEYKEKHIYIDDICIWDINKGYGSLAMKYLIEYATNMGCKYISGCLMGKDIIDHKDRLFHFYKKFNFTIKEFKTPKNGYHIKLELSTRQKSLKQ